MSIKYIELAPGGKLGVTAVFEIDGKRTFLEAEAMQSLAAKHADNPQRSTWMELAKKMMNGEIDLETVPNFESEDNMSAEQQSLPVAQDDAGHVPTPLPGIEFVAVTRGGDGVVAIMKVNGTDMPCTWEGLKGLAEAHSAHEEAPMWIEIALQIEKNTPIHEITTTHQAGMANS